jgi:hypothetical protein
MNKRVFLITLVLFVTSFSGVFAGGPCLLNIKDNIGDDKGTGYYQYPVDRRLRRGTFDIKSFKVYDEGNVFTFVIQIRNYIMREWSDTRASEDQGFVANLFDIYIDADGRENSGYDFALPGRDVFFDDKMGWEKVVLVSPLSELSIFEILRDKTDELSFQNQIEDIVYPDYVNVQRDKFIVKISKKKLPGVTKNSGFQLFSLGYQKVISPNRLLNREVRSFATADAFGGGLDTHGDPPIIDMIVPKGDDQYRLLRDFRSEPYREDIEYAAVPFVYCDQSRISPVRRKRMKPAAPVFQPAPVIQSHGKQPGFVPLKPATPTPSTSGFQPIPQSPSGFVPIKRRKN